jgi:hypothetical protein
LYKPKLRERIDNMKNKIFTLLVVLLFSLGVLVNFTAQAMDPTPTEEEHPPETPVGVPTPTDEQPPTRPAVGVPTPTDEQPPTRPAVGVPTPTGE